MTTTALKAIDSYGGIDNYLLRLDERSVSASNYVTKMRNMIATRLFHQGTLDPQLVRRLGYDKSPPSVEAEGSSSAEDIDDKPHLQ